MTKKSTAKQEFEKVMLWLWQKCLDRAAQRSLPPWVTEADVDAVLDELKQDPQRKCSGKP